MLLPDPEIVIVGGGPIGCWTALQIRKRIRGARITVYESKKVYERDHILSIRESSFFQWSKSTPENAAFLSAIFNAQATFSIASGLHGGGPKTQVDLRDAPNNIFAYWKRLPRILDIRTIDFGRLVKEECQKSGVTFVYRDMKTPDEVMDLHPACTRFVAADGAHSKMRAALWDGENGMWRRDIFPSIDFNYTSHGQARYLRVNTYDKLGHVYAENIGIEKDGKSLVNLRLIVSPREYAAIPPADFRKPLIVTPDAEFWNDTGVSPVYGRTLEQDFYDLVRLRTQHANEHMTGGDVRMTKIYLSQYRARKFAKRIERNGRRADWFLVGDAAMGMPFYRSINSGLILGSQLAYLLATSWVGREFKAVVYNYYTRPFRILREGANVRRTELRVRLYTGVIRPLLYKIARRRRGRCWRGRSTSHCGT